ncbi:MAG TPA: crossover junction endodeoxyribonuclease RuvC [Nitrospinota bacterium]|nr:crossover junction endodeoxyribonuclease RuvC [Nitrospinota bacterium]
MRVLGIDPGSIITGYGIVEKNGRDLKTIKWGAIRTKSNQSFPEKLKKIYDDLTEIIKTYEPSSAAIENIFFAKNAKSALKLGQVRGATILASINSGLKTAEYTPLEIKQSVTGYGRADKAQMQIMVTKLLCLKETPKPFDASDALAVAICHLHSAAFKKRIGR